MIRTLFLGTPAAAVPALAALSGVAEVAGVVTQPDAARGRRSQRLPAAVKQAATEWGFPVYQPEDAASLHEVVAGAAPDVGIVVAYGRLLRQDLLDLCPFGFLNVHFSLLPRWRGAAPVERAIIAGDATTGVSIMQLEAGMDTGPVVASRETDIAAADTGGTLTARLAHIGADLLIDSLEGYVSGSRVPAPQIAGLATVAPRLTTAEAQLHAAVPVAEAERMVRAFNPRPGAWLVVDGERIKVHAAATAQTRVAPGALVFADGVPVVGLRGGSLELVTVQPAGHSVMAGAAWGHGRRGEPGTLDAPP